MRTFQPALVLGGRVGLLHSCLTAVSRETREGSFSGFSVAVFRIHYELASVFTFSTDCLIRINENDGHCNLF